MRVLIAVTHLLGVGHLTRAVALARALAAAGHEVVLASGGAPAPLIRFDGIRLIQIPALHVRGTAFGQLLAVDGSEADNALLDRRRRMLLDTLDETAPDAVVTELFPFGRRRLAQEFLALIEAARARRPRPLILASIRDILVAPDASAKVRDAHEQVARLYDAVLVHGDPGLIPLDASWPVDDALRARLRYTGYVDDSAPVVASADREGILVAAGSGGAGLGLLRAAVEAARRKPDLGWRILAGQAVAEADFVELGQGLAEGVLARARPDYRALLARSKVSVSQCGYNTAVDLLATGAAAVLVPFEAGRETEQRLRGATLADRGLAHVLLEADLTAESLLNAVTAALAGAPPAPHGIDLNGAPRSVAIIEELARPSLARPTRSYSGLDRLRAALDAAAERGIRVPVWWRDDDAVAATPALDRLIALAEDHAAPILVAAIPAAVEFSLGKRIDGASGVGLAVHGLAHSNHAPDGAKPAEFGPHRLLAFLVAEAAEGLRLARERLPDDRLLRVFVPPWNRIAPDLANALSGLGYVGLSAAAGPAVAA